MRIFFTLALAFACSPAWAAMPVTEQNALVKRYCAVCHTDASRNGGLSLEHYNAATRDPALAAMMLSKMNVGAMGAAGSGVPDKNAQKEWLDSTIEQAAGATKWFVASQAGVVTASIVRDVSPRKPDLAHAPLYRIKMNCNPVTRAGEAQLTWSPQPQTGITMTAWVDGNAPLLYKIDGVESMGNGGTVRTGHASVFLTGGANADLPFPNQSLTIRDLFPGETVEFPFADLDQRTREALSTCFPVPPPSQHR